MANLSKILGRFKGKKQPIKSNQRAFKKQSDFYDAKPEAIDFISPSMIKETLPSEITHEGVKFNDYAVEVGGTIVPTRYFRSFFAEITAGNTWAGMLDTLIKGDFGEGDLDIAIHVRPAESNRELDAIGRRIAGLQSDKETEKNQTKRDSMQEEIDDLKARQRRIRRNIERSYRVSIQAVASSQDWKSLKMYCNALVKRFAGKSIIMKSADGRQLNALKAILPLSHSDAPKEHFISMETSNLADLFPFGRGGLTHRTGILIGTDLMGRPAFLENWHPSFPNQHGAVIGRSGAGKTHAVMLIVNRNLHIKRRAAILDWKGEYKDFMLIMGLPFIELSQYSPDRINPYDVDITELPNGTRYVDIEEAANAVQAMVFKMISVYDRNALTGEVKVFIQTAIREQYTQDAKITEIVDSLYQNSGSTTSDGRFRIGKVLKEMPALSGLFTRMISSNIEAVAKAAEFLKPFTKHGNVPSYAIFDGQSTVQIQDVPAFAIALNRLDKEVMRPIGLIAAERWITEKWAKKNPHIKKIQVIEEAQNIFNDLDYGAIWAENTYREGRSTTTAIYSVTQGLEVYSQSKAGIAAIKNSTVKIIGLQEKYDIESVHDKLHLSEGEANFLINQARRGLMVLKAGNESTIVQFKGTEYEDMLFCNESTDPLFAKRKEYMRTIFGEQEIQTSLNQAAAASS